MNRIDSDLEHYLTEILDQSKNGIIITDPNQERNPVIFVNQTTCDTFGYKCEDFLGRNCGFLHRKDKDQEGLREISQAIKDKTDITVTLRNYTKSGKLVYNQITISPIFDEKRDLKYFLGVQRDITKEILLQQENKSLEEQRVDNAQYTAIGKLSAGLSHEINTPLTIIKGTIEMLKNSIETLQSNSKKEYMIEDLTLIEENLNRIKNVTESMRSIADTHPFTLKKMNLYRALVIPLRLTFNRSKNITPIRLQQVEFNLDIDREKQEYLIKGDAQKLEQAFIAIIDNSLDQLEAHSNFDENRLTIDIIENNQTYEVVFYDNGGGIDPKLLPNIFKPFEAGKKHKGLGIGLSMVKNIIDQHNFEIEAKNFEKGIQVIISIPKG